MNADLYNELELKAGRITPAHISALTRYYQRDEGLDTDGKLGPNTRASVLPPADAAPPAPGVWPLRALKDGRVPVVTSAFRPKERPNHPGNDIFYAYKEGDPPMKVGDSGRTAKWWIPEGTVAIATHDSEVVAASMIPTGFRVRLQIAPGWFTNYIHLQKLQCAVGDKLKAGDPVGVVGDNPKDYDADHLHFELYQGKYPDGLKDPQLILKGATVLPCL